MLFMPWLRSKAAPAGLAAIFLLSLAYPTIVYFTRDHVAPLAFIGLAELLLLLRFLTLPAHQAREWRPVLLIALVLLPLLAMLDAELASRFYPVLLSLTFAAVFTVSLWRPPSLIERLARLRHGALPPEGQVYCRRLTMIWAAWLIANAAIAAVLAIMGADEYWALWTGLISYVVMGALFAGDYILRQTIYRSFGRA
ncbi:hypothetical protein [Ferrovibrio terrae]|uniref:hypothetical protein n=1 Tax=Ferrovibrio terrae TaxID=2594003 RepID=UPI0031377895